MEPTSQNLEKLPLNQLRVLARKRNLSPIGSKKVLIQRILDYENKGKPPSIPVPKAPTPKAISKPVAKGASKPISPDRTSEGVTPILTLPYEVQKLQALKLKYPDILNLCKANKNFARICRDNNFWRSKILNDYRDKLEPEELEKLKPEQYRAKYEELYADELDLESRQYFYNKYKEDKEWQKYNDEWDKTGKEIERLREEAKKLEKRQDKIHKNQIKVEDRYKAEGSKLSYQAEKLRAKNVKILPQEYEYQYFDIRIIPEAIEDLNLNVQSIPNNNPAELAKLLYKEGLVNKEYKFKQGNLIGISDSNNRKTQNPNILFYIYKFKGKLLFDWNVDEQYGVENIVEEYPEKLIDDIKEQGYKTKDIKRLYDLPFDMEVEEEGDEKENEPNFRYFEIPTTRGPINNIIQYIRDRKGKFHLSDLQSEDTPIGIVDKLQELPNLRAGDLIGFKDTAGPDNQIPRVLIYVFNKNDHGDLGYGAAIDAKSVEDLNFNNILKDDMEKKGYSLYEFNEVFPVPFILERSEKEEELEPVEKDESEEEKEDLSYIYIEIPTTQEKIDKVETFVIDQTPSLRELNAFLIAEKLQKFPRNYKEGDILGFITFQGQSNDQIPKLLLLIYEEEEGEGLSVYLMRDIRSIADLELTDIGKMYEQRNLDLENFEEDYDLPFQLDRAKPKLLKKTIASKAARKQRIPRKQESTDVDEGNEPTDIDEPEEEEDKYRKYVNYELSREQLDRFVDFLGSVDYGIDRQDLDNFLQKQKIPIKRGTYNVENLIGFTLKGQHKDVIPEVLIYITRKDGNEEYVVLTSYQGETIDDFPRQLRDKYRASAISAEQIYEDYKLPFHL